jgi:hypothetical protein
MSCRVFVLALLLSIVNLASAEWYTVNTIGLPQSLIAGQEYDNVSLVITNTTQSVATITSAVTAVPKGFPTNSVNDCTSVTLAPQASCVLATAAIYRAASDSVATWAATVNDGFETFPKQVNLSVTTGLDASISQLPANMSVGQKEPVQIDVLNTAATDVQGLDVRLPNIAGLTYASNTCAAMTILKAGANCQVQGTFEPVQGATGVISVDASVSDSSGRSIKLQTNTNVSAVSVSGEAIYPNGNVSIGGSEKFRYVFKNTSDANAADVSVTLPDDTGLVIEHNGCEIATLNAGKRCEIKMIYTPPEPGSANAELHSFTAVLKYEEGNDVEATHEVTISPVPVNGDVSAAKGNVAIGGTPDTFTYTFTNTGAAAATGVTIQEPQEPGFVIDAVKTTCSTGTDIPATKSCRIVASYTPPVDAQGKHIFRVILGYAEGGDAVVTHTSEVSAVPVTASVLAPSSSVNIGDTDYFTYYFYNDGTSATSGVKVTFPQVTEPGFAVINDACTGQATPGGEYCLVEAKYTPPVGTLPGQHIFTAVYQYAEGGDLVANHTSNVLPAALIPLVGVASPALANVTPGETENFIYYFQNDNDTNVAIDKVIKPTDKRLTYGASTCTSEIAANSSCSIEVSFTPLATDTGEQDFSARLLYQSGEVSATHIAFVGSPSLLAYATPTDSSIGTGDSDVFSYVFQNYGATMPITNVHVDLPINVPGLVIDTNGCTGVETLEPGEGCQIDATYTAPTDPAPVLGVPLSLPARFSFGNNGDAVVVTHKVTVNTVPVAGESAPTYITAKNQQDVPITYTFYNLSKVNSVQGIKIKPPINANTTVVSDSCVGAPLLVNGSCELKVMFHAEADGANAVHILEANFYYTEHGTVPIKATCVVQVPPR